MKITVYSIKGSAGKTPIATNIALDHEYCVGTNESIDCYSHILDKEQYIKVGQNEEFPKFAKETDMVFDLSGSIGDKALSITSAIKQSNVVVVPIYNHVRSLHGGISTILEVSNFTKNIVVVATKLKKSKEYLKKRKTGVINKYSWREDCEDFLNIKKQVEANVDFKIPIMPLRFSNGFDIVDDEEKSIIQLVKSSKLYNHYYRIEAIQLSKIYKLLKNYE